MQLTKENLWHSIYQSTDAFSSEIIKLKLESEGISVLVFNEKDSSYNAFGYIHLQVRKDDIEQAKTIIDNWNE